MDNRDRMAKTLPIPVLLFNFRKYNIDIIATNARITILNIVEFYFFTSGKKRKNSLQSIKKHI